jgi:hypothetical protein
MGLLYLHLYVHGNMLTRGTEVGIRLGTTVIVEN